jgi:ribonuclease PH
MNLVMTGAGQFVEVQGNGEESTFGEEQLSQMLALGRTGIGRLIALQQAALS